MRRAILTLACFVALMLVMIAPAAAQDPGPVADAMATLAAATVQAEQVRASQRATAAAISAESARLANIAQATARAQSAQATTQAQNVRATEQAQSLAATQSAMDDLNRQRAMTATAQAANMAATVTSQAVMIAAQQTCTAQEAADAARLSETYATRQERFTFGLLLVEIFFVCGALFVLWHVVKALVAWVQRMRPQAERPLSRLIADAPQKGKPVVIDAQPVGSRMPETMTVVDDPGMVDAINRWAEKFDAERGLNYGN